MSMRTKSLLAAALVAAASVTTPAAASGPDRMPVPYDLGGGYVITSQSGGSSCRRATFDEMQTIRRRAPETVLHVINPEKLAKARGSEAGGMTIILRATPQLESFPAAKAAYIRAAETWEALVRTPITIIIDVDFGPTRFGEPYPQFVLGSTDSQFGNFAYSWSSVRSRLLSHANSQAETDLLNRLPPSTGVPTSVGNATLVYIPSSVQRALGIIGPVANPTAEQDNLGDPPSIGFNSAFAYDFDPTDGIDSNKQDFNATAVHEMGHALGFDSWVGLQELDSTIPPLVTTWDLLRFHPGVTLDAFASTQRVLSSGGEQIEFAGGATTRLSTGRPDGTGGDMSQASHWKDNVLNNNVYIGIMDPTGADGDKDQLTAIDLATLDLIGFDVKGLVSFDDATSVLDGNTLTISGMGTVANLVLTSAVVKLFDGSGQSLTTLPAVPINAVGSSLVPLTLEVPGLENFLTATAAEVVLVDDKGNQSTPLRVDFSQADAGGPTIGTLTYNGKKMKLTGTGFAGTGQLEVDGVVAPATVKIKSATKASVKGTPAVLGLRSGPNRVRVLANGARSNIFILNN